MLSFKFLLLLFFGLFMQTALATSYGLVSDVVTPGDDDHASQAPGNGFVTAVSDSDDDTISDNALDAMTTGTSSVDTLLDAKTKGCIGSVCSPSNMCLCRNKSGVRVYCYCENPGKKCRCGRDALASRDVIDAGAEDTVVDEGTVPDVGADGADVSDAATDAVTSDDDAISDNALDVMTTGTSSVNPLLDRKPKGCWGMCSPSNMCLCRSKGVRVYCYCETPGKKCSCGRDARASRDVIDADAKDTVDEGDAISDVGADGADISDAVTSDDATSDNTTPEDIDSSDEDTSAVNTLLNKSKQQCHGTCKKCIGNCKDKYQCLCKGRDVVARCGCERLGEKCQCTGPWRAVRDVPSLNVNSTAVDEEESATPSTEGADAASEDLDDAAAPVPGVSPLSVFMESKPITCHGVMCSKEGKCHCKHGAYNIVCPCHKLGAPCYCKNWRRDETPDSVDAAVAETADTTPETPVAADNTSVPEDEDTEVSSPPGFSHAVNDEFSILQRTCYGTCSRKHKCSCRGKTCRCQIPGESCKCYFPFLPPRELESMPTFPENETEAEAEVDDTVVTSTTPNEDIDTGFTDDTIIPSDIANEAIDAQADDTETETATSPIPTENSPLVARGEPCWGVCDKYRHCYCGHIRTNCDCSKRGHRCYCASGPNDLPPGMGGGVTY